MCLEKIRLRVQSMVTILGSTINIIGGATWSFKEQANFYFDNEQDTHMSYQNHEENNSGSHIPHNVWSSMGNFLNFIKVKILVIIKWSCRSPNHNYHSLNT